MVEENDPSIAFGKLPAWQEVIHQTWDNSRVLPWTHLEGPLKHEVLIQHQQQALTDHASSNQAK